MYDIYLHIHVGNFLDCGDPETDIDEVCLANRTCIRIPVGLVLPLSIGDMSVLLRI